MTLKLRFFYRWSHEGLDINGHPPSLMAARNINDLKIGEPHPFYILSGALSDFLAHHPGLVDEALEDIAKLERGAIQTAEWGGEGFCHSLTPTKVTFEHAIFGECPEWPIWSCTLAQYKAALQGWRKFIDMPKSIDTELIVELPEGIPN